MAQIFTITDGTTSIDLMGASSNYVLANYETGLNQWKSGGVFSGSELSEGSVPVFRQYDMFEEKITLHIKGTTQDNALANLRALLTLLESGVEWFISGLGNQLYMALKGNDETNTRYAVITSYKIEELPRLFDSHFEVGGKQANTSVDTIINDLEIVLTRGLWMESPPGTETRAYLASNLTYNGSSYGVSASNTDVVFFSDYDITPNITHIFRFDSSAGTYSSNLVDGSLPYNMFPTPPDSGDAIYFGVSAAAEDFGQFFNLIFTVGTEAGSSPTESLLTGSAQIYNGTWNTVTSTFTGLLDLMTTGLKVFSWDDSSGGLTTTTINGVSGKWVRLLLTSNWDGTNPTIATRNPYTSTNPFIDIQATGLGGDLDALSKIELHRYSLSDENKLVIGRRLYSRGSAFTSHLNYSDIQPGIPLEVSLLLAAETGAVYTNQTAAPTGRAVSLVPPTDFWKNNNISPPRFIFGSSFTDTPTQYVGKYRAFARVIRMSGGSAGDVIARVSVTASPTTKSVTYPEVELNGPIGVIEALDLGIIELPAGYTKNVVPYDIYLDLDFMRIIAASITIQLIDMVLIPADEAIMEIDPQDSEGNNYAIVIDKISSPQEPVDVTFLFSDKLVMKPLYGGSDGISLARERQRLWMFGYNRKDNGAGTNTFYNDCFYRYIFGAEVFKINRYLIPRGSS